MNTYWHRGAALFMIYLTLSLVLISAHSLRASAVFQVSISGQDSLEGFRRTNDTTQLNVFADSNIVTLLGAAGGLNLSCTNTSGGYHCTYTFPQGFQAAGAYTLNLEQESGTPLSTSASYIVDGQGPEFSRAEITQLGTSLTAAYTLQDLSSPTTPTCSGLEQVRLVVNENTIATQHFPSPSCAESGLLTGTAAGLSGTANIYLIATDKLGNTGISEVQQRFVDTLPPALPATFQLLREGADLEQISTDADSEVRVTLAFTIVEENLLSVTVDASDLTTSPALQQPYSSPVASCTPSNGAHYCTLANLRLNPLDGDLHIDITARDQSGNEVRGTARKILRVENTKPSITYIGREDGCTACFLSRGENDLLVKLEAPGSMNAARLFLTTEGESIHLDECRSTGTASWECNGHFTLRSGTSGEQRTLHVSPSSSDDVGNQMLGLLQQEFTIDDTPPSFLGQPATDALCPTAGQRLTLNVRARETESPRVTLTANVSAVTDREIVTTTCNRVEDDEFLCALVIDSFISSHTTAEVPLTLVDAAGNSRSRPYQIEICEAEIEATPNFISNVQLVSTPPVDKRIASLLPFRVLLPLSMDVRGGARVIHVESATCSNPWIVGPSYVLNEFTQAPILVTHYQAQLWENGTVDLNCTLDFQIRRGNTVYQQTEREEINAALPLVRQELGNPVQAIRDKEQQIVANIEHLQEKIDSRAKLENSIGKICDLAETLGTVNAALQAVKAIMYAVSLVIEGFTGAGSAIWTPVENALSTIHGLVNTYIWPTGWVGGGGRDGGTSAGAAFSEGGNGAAIGYIVKWVCGLYRCKMYDAKEWASIALESYALALRDVDAQVAPREGSQVIDKEGNVLGTYRNTDPVTGESYPEGPRLVRESEILISSLPGIYRQVLHEPVNIDTTNFQAAYVGRGKSTSLVFYTDDEAFKKAKVGQRVRRAADPYLTQLLQTRGVVASIPSTDEVFGDDWVVNPFRSTHYDAMCIPAQLYNLRKEKQLQCLRLKCIDDLAVQGVPITVCEERYRSQSCLYVESAEAKRNPNIREKLHKGAAGAALQAVLGWGVQCGFKAMCGGLYEDDSSGGSDPCMISNPPCGRDQWGQLTGCGGAMAVVCGLVGGFMDFQELEGYQDYYATLNSGYTVPQGEDYCEGLEEQFGITADGTAEDSRGGLL